MRHQSIALAALFFALTLFFSILSCGNPDSRGINDFPESREEFRCDSLSIMELINRNNTAQTVKKFRELIKSNNDSCVLSFLKFTANAYLVESSHEKFKILDTLSCYFDGYVSEYFVDVLYNIVSGDSKRFVIHLSSQDNQTGYHTCLFRSLKLYLDVYDDDKSLRKILLKEKSSGNIAAADFWDDLLENENQ